MRNSKHNGRGARGWVRLLVALLTLQLTVAVPATAGRTFTDEHPLQYEDAWDLWPYVYLNDSGEPEGYNIDLLKLICKELNIPYTIKLKPTAEALKDLRRGRADLMMGMAANFHDEYAKYSKTVIQLFTHSVVYPKEKPLKVRSISDLAHNRVIVHEGSFSHHLMQDCGWGENAVGYDDMKEAVLKANIQRELPIVWNTLSLKWLLTTFQIEDMGIEPINIPAGEYRFMSNNVELLASIDSVYSILQARDQLQPLQNKWFYPERVEPGIPDWVWILAVVLMVGLLLFFIYYIWLHLRERRVTALTRKANDRLSIILQASGVQTFIYETATQTFFVLGNDGKPLRKYPLDAFCAYLIPEDRVRFREFIRQVSLGEVEEQRFTLKASTYESPEVLEYAAAVSVLRRGRNGMPTMLIATRSDITEQHRRQERTRDNMLRYQAIFNTPMVDMVYYNAKGQVEDINQKGCETFHATAEEMRSRKMPFYETIGMSHEWFETFDFFHATVKLNEMFYELQLMPVCDDEGHRVGFYGSGLDVTNIVKAYHELRHSIDLMEEANDKIKEYIDNINYVLRVGGIRVVTYSPDEHIVRIFAETNKIQFELTQNRSLCKCDERFKPTLSRLFDTLDDRKLNPPETGIKTTIAKKDGTPLYLLFHFIPQTDNDGRVTSYFGICRDISEIKATKRQLAAETQKMQDIESVKNAFLRNMSYEIRTPLTSVVGFAEMFQMEHDPEEETLFIQQIKDNSRSLLTLVNNILFLSRLDAKMIEIKRQPVDFAMIFDGICQAAWADYVNPGVNYASENPYNHLVVDIDEANLGTVISHVVANAAQHTDTGFVRTRYDYNGNALSITVEDSGCGIPEEQLSRIFERFVTGSSSSAGLGLSICHELVSMMGGDISIKSIQGKGTIVWIVIPCEVSEIDHK